MKFIVLFGLFMTSLPHLYSFDNQIIVSVGDIAITSFDLKQMQGFDESISRQKISPENALKKLINTASLLVIADQYPEYYMDETELRKNINTLTNNSSDPSAKARRNVFIKYESIYRMFLRADKVRKGLIAGNIQIRNIMNQPIPPKEIKAFYNKNKAQLTDSPYPKLDLLLFAVETTPRLSLSDLEEIEKNLQSLANKLNSSSNEEQIRKEFGKKLKFTSYSGRTQLLTPDILILQKKIPDEVIGIALRDEIPLGPKTITITKNKGIYIPQPIPMQSTGKPTYIVLKILDIQEPQQLSLKDAEQKIEEIIRFQRGDQAIDDMIKTRIAEGQITLTPIDNQYNKIFKIFSK
ncbi:MAG: hypothetical protein ACRCV0_05880 [Brevinema sp.]